MAACWTPRPTRRTAYRVAAPAGPIAWCPGCKSYQPAGQVAAGRERRNSRHEITASYAPLPHERPAP